MIVILVRMLPFFFSSLCSIGRSEPAPDRAPSVSYTGDLGTTPGGPAAADARLGGFSLPRWSFEDLLVTVMVLESSGGGGGGVVYMTAF